MSLTGLNSVGISRLDLGMTGPDTASVKCLGFPGYSESDREPLLLKWSCGWKAGSLSGNHVDGDPHPAETDRNIWTLGGTQEPSPSHRKGKSSRLNLTLLLAQQNEGQELESQWVTEKFKKWIYFLRNPICDWAAGPLLPSFMVQFGPLLWHWLSIRVDRFFYLFVAALGLHHCVQAFSSCGERGLLSLAVRGGFSCWGALVLGAWASGDAAPRLSSCCAWALGVQAQ